MLQGVVLVQGLIVYWTGLSHFYYLVLNFLVSLLKHRNELSLKLQIISKYRLHLQFEVSLQLKVSDYLGRAVVVLMNHMNKLVLNLLIRVLRLLDQLFHAVNYHNGNENSTKFELSLTLTEFFRDFKIILLSVISHWGDNFGSNLVLLGFAQ
jgi:hypothetical protein